MQEPSAPPVVNCASNTISEIVVEPKNSIFNLCAMNTTIPRPIQQPALDFAYDFDADGILRHVHTGERYSVKLNNSAPSLRRLEMTRALCARLVRQRLFELDMQASQIPIPGHPTLCMRVLHSRSFFTHKGPILIVLQGGGNLAQAGVWAPRLLIHPEHGLNPGSQLSLVKKAHDLDIPVALVNANEYVPTEAEMDALEQNKSNSVDSDFETFKSKSLGALHAHSQDFASCIVSKTGNDVTTSAAVPVIYAPGIYISSNSIVTNQLPVSPSYAVPGCSSFTHSIVNSESVITNRPSGSSSRSTFVSPFARPLPFLSQSSHSDMIAGTSQTRCSLSEFVPCSQTGAHAHPSQTLTCTLPEQATVTFMTSDFGSPVPQNLEKQPMISASTVSSFSLNDRPMTILKPSNSDLSTDNTYSSRSSDHFSIKTDPRVSNCTSGSDPLPNYKPRIRGPQNLDVSIEDRLYGVWRQLVPHCASNHILVWAHQIGGMALVYPLTPMPGIFPGFPLRVPQKCINLQTQNRKNKLKSPKSRHFNTHPKPSFSLHETKLNFEINPDNKSSQQVISTSASVIVSNDFSTKSVGDNSSFQRPYDNKLSQSVSNPNCLIKPTTYRRRHMSAGPVLLSSDNDKNVMLFEGHMPRVSEPKLENETSHSTLLRNIIDQSAHTSRMTSGHKLNIMHPKAPNKSLWLDRRVCGQWRHHVTPQAARRAFWIPGEIGRQSGVNDATSPSNFFPYLSGSDHDCCVAAQRGGIVPKDSGPWADLTGNPEDDVMQDELLKIRLARAWQRKAERLWFEFENRVAAVVFTDFPDVLNLRATGIGWGLNMLQPSNDSDSPRLFKHSNIPRPVPDVVIKVRKWLAEHSVNYIAANQPIGARMNHPTVEPTIEIPILSAGTTEHDLIPTQVLDSAFDFYQTKLRLSGVELTSKHLTKLESNKNYDVIKTDAALNLTNYPVSS